MLGRVLIIGVAVVGVAGCGALVQESGGEAGDFAGTSGATSDDVSFGNFVSADEEFASHIESQPIMSAAASTTPTGEIVPADPRFCRVAVRYYQRAKGYIESKIQYVEMYPDRALSPRMAYRIDQWAFRLKTRLGRLRAQLAQIDPALVLAFNQAERLFDDALRTYHLAVLRHDEELLQEAVSMLVDDLDEYLSNFLRERCSAYAQ